MMGYQAKWVWSSPQMTLMKSNPQMTQMTQIFGCDDSHAEVAATGHNKTGRSRRGRGVKTAMSPAAEGRERDASRGLRPAVGSPRICGICAICGCLSANVESVDSAVS